MFLSIGYKVDNVKPFFPDFTSTRIMMMPFYIQDVDSSLPVSLNAYKPLLKRMLANTPEHVEYYDTNTAYLTIDEKVIKPGHTHRKPGLHVDGMFNNTLSGAWGGGGGGWGSCGNGMLLTSNTDDLCTMWTGQFDGLPINDGDCQHLEDQLHDKQAFVFKAGDVVWADGLCVHKAQTPTITTYRQFVRISLPNNAPWFIGYTENPLGIKPCGQILNQCRITGG